MIFHSLERTHFPPNIIQYVRNQYENTQSVTVTNSFKTEPFSFKRGVFQGDPLSPIIFLLAFNPVIESLQAQKQFGFEISGDKFITLPYADDFCLITTNQRTHQRLMNSISNNIESMGMRIKPSKCRTFSIKSGSPSVVDFNFNGVHIPSIFAEEQKYLGKVISYSGKSSDTFELVKEIFREKLENIDQTMVRNEYKLWIYQNYFLNSHRFLLTIHDITQTDLKVLDRFTDKYLKNGQGFPSAQQMPFSILGLG